MRVRATHVILGALLLQLAGVSESHAVPELGVGSSLGYVNATAGNPYQTYWGPSISGSGEGYALGASGSDLHVFTNIQNADIYLLTTSDVGTGNNIKFNGAINVYQDTNVFRSYDPTPYYGIDLGPVNTNTWTSLPSNPFSPGKFFSLDVAVTYTGKIGANQWIFAAADTNGLAGLQAKSTKVWADNNGVDGIQTEGGYYWVDDNGIPGPQFTSTKETTGTGKYKKVTWVAADTYKEYAADTVTNFSADPSSPQTTSARGGVQPVPEPGTFLLFGTGLAGVGLFGRRSRKK